MKHKKHITHEQLIDLFDCGGFVIIKGQKNWLKFKDIFFPMSSAEEAVGIFSSMYIIGNMRILFSEDPQFIERVLKI